MKTRDCGRAQDRTIAGRVSQCLAATGFTRCFAPEGEYFASVGPLPGTRARGHEEIRNLVQAMFTVDDGASADICAVTIQGDSASWRWCYQLPDGSRVLGCDFLTFKDNQIILKDAYRKVFA